MRICPVPLPDDPRVFAPSVAGIWLGEAHRGNMTSQGLVPVRRDSIFKT